MTDQKTNPVLAFDVYGTLIDPFHMEEHLRAFFWERAKEASELWRGKQVEYSFRRGLMKKYQNFDVCTAQALRFVSEQMGVTVSDKAVDELLTEYLRLPAYPDVSDSLSELAALGLKLVAFSNGTPTAVRALLDHANIFRHFSAIISVDSVGTFKPDPAVYEYLVEEMRVSKENVWLISSNPFDVIGAKASGLRTAWLRRDPKRVFDPWEFGPDVILSGLTELLQKLNLV